MKYVPEFSKLDMTGFNNMAMFLQDSSIEQELKITIPIIDYQKKLKSLRSLKNVFANFASKQKIESIQTYSLNVHKLILALVFDLEQN